MLCLSLNGGCMTLGKMAHWCWTQTCPPRCWHRRIAVTWPLTWKKQGAGRSSLNLPFPLPLHFAGVEWEKWGRKTIIVTPVEPPPPRTLGVRKKQLGLLSHTRLVRQAKGGQALWLRRMSSVETKHASPTKQNHCETFPAGISSSPLNEVLRWEKLPHRNFSPWQATLWGFHWQSGLAVVNKQR